eukprot:2438050-Rhodomonas_salina.2
MVRMTNITTPSQPLNRNLGFFPLKTACESKKSGRLRLRRVLSLRTSCSRQRLFNPVDNKAYGDLTETPQPPEIGKFAFEQQQNSGRAKRRAAGAWEMHPMEIRDGGHKWEGGRDVEGHFVARNGKGESSKMSGGHVPAESLPWGKEAQPAPIARTLERKPSQKFRRAAWKIGRTHSAKPKFDISKVIRAWKVKNEVPRWMQQTQEDAKAMFAAAKPREKAEALRNFAVQQQSKLPLWEFLVKLSAQTEDLEPEEDLFESHWEEVENILDIKKKDVAGAAATEIQAHTDFGPMGDLPIHTCFLLCYSGRTEKLRSVMKYEPAPLPLAFSETHRHTDTQTALSLSLGKVAGHTLSLALTFRHTHTHTPVKSLNLPLFRKLPQPYPRSAMSRCNVHAPFQSAFDTFNADPKRAVADMRIAKEVVQHCYMTGEWPTINEPYENDFHLWLVSLRPPPPPVRLLLDVCRGSHQQRLEH